MFDLEGLLNNLFGYPLNFITTPYMDAYNKRIQDIMVKNNCIAPQNLGYNPQTMTSEEIDAFEKKTNEEAIKYTTCRDSIRHDKTTPIDTLVRHLDTSSGIAVLAISGVVYYFNRDKISVGKYLLGLGCIAAGGYVVAKVNRSIADKKHNAELAQIQAANAPKVK